MSQRTLLIFLVALLIGIAAGTLTYLAGYPLAEAVLAGGAASGTAVPVLHKLID